LLQLVDNINGAILWTNLHLLFWLSLLPFSTAWMGQHYREPWPVALYGIVLLFSGFAFFLLVQAIVRDQGDDSKLGAALGSDIKGKISPALYALGIPFAFIAPWISIGLYVVVAVIWFIPDRRVEGALRRSTP
jgi:uncharacterized membrane protein